MCTTRRIRSRDEFILLKRDLGSVEEFVCKETRSVVNGCFGRFVRQDAQTWSVGVRRLAHTQNIEDICLRQLFRELGLVGDHLLDIWASVASLSLF